MSRRIARAELFKIVFEAEMNGILPDSILEKYMEREEVILSHKGKEFLIKYVKGISKYNDELNEIIQKNMQGWSLERIGNVEHSLLKCATYELLFEETGVEIIINEVVELAKIYGDEKSFEFINGVLANIIRTK